MGINVLALLMGTIQNEVFRENNVDGEDYEDELANNAVGPGYALPYLELLGYFPLRGMD